MKYTKTNNLKETTDKNNININHNANTYSKEYKLMALNNIKIELYYNNYICHAYETVYPNTQMKDMLPELYNKIQEHIVLTSGWGAIHAKLNEGYISDKYKHINIFIAYRQTLLDEVIDEINNN